MAKTNGRFPQFDTDEILWYNNGKWGEAGYAVPNPGGKTWTNNSVIFQMVQLVGRNMFELCHRPESKFYGPPHKQLWFDLHQLIVTARKRMADRLQMPNDSNGLLPQHATPTPQVFMVYPIPYFGERIRQPDIREYTQLSLLMLSEMMQHSDNEKLGTISSSFTGTVGKYMQEILSLFSTKYFGYTRAESYAAGFALKDTDFINYDPSKVMTSVEMTEERPPLQWWPTENDLSQIRGLPMNDALNLCERWPSGNWRDVADGNVFPNPDNQGGAGGAAAGGQTVVGFTAPPSQAP